MTIVLRELESADLDVVSGIEAAIGPDPWSRSLFAGELDLPASSRHWLVADVGDRVVGYGGIMVTADTAHVLNLGVHPGWVRRRLAQRICCELALAALDRGAQGLTLEVRASNEAAVALYQKLSMIESGRRERYYPDGEDALIYWLHDLPSDAVGARLQTLRDEAREVNR